VEDLPLVLLDTNALLMPFQMGLDVEAEIERAMGSCRIAVPMVVIAELQAMEGSVKFVTAALKLAERFEVLETVGLGDNAIVELAKRSGGIVVTGDRGLVGRRRKEGLQVRRPRQKSRLELR
jgi:rRNA-processing protein FCF1